jgi:hypothetical protein
MNKELDFKAEKLVRLEMERLDAMALALWNNKNDPRTSETILHIMERRAKYKALDAPTRTENVNRQEGPIEYRHNLKLASDEDLQVMEGILKRLEGGSNGGADAPEP